MKHYLFNKLLLSKLNDSAHEGFTLIELVVVVIIVGILVAISIPNLISNIGKARESEATSNLGALSRSQQAYHFETQEFAPSLNSLDQNISVITEYYDFPDPTIANNTIVKHQALALAPWSNASRNYAIGVYHNSGEFSSTLCRAAVIASPVNVPDVFSDPCSNNGIKVR